MLFGRDPNDGLDSCIIGWIILYIALIVMFFDFLPYFLND
jgi:hypothetical protein